MEDKLPTTAFDSSENSEKKYSYSHKDVKRKLSFVNKKIGDLQRQRKFAYKNSAKVKRTIHCQVNQIVKCLRARERNLWADVDEAYLCQDENISDELTRLQFIHAQCQTLFDHLDGNKGNISVLDKIYSVLSDVTLGEKPTSKPLEFISGFETMKEMATNFGYLDGDFVKKEEFIFIDKKDDFLPNTLDKFTEKRKQLEVTCVDTDEFNYKNTSEDSFEIVDMTEDMSCDEFEKDSFEAWQDFRNSGQPDKKVNPPFGDGTKSRKESDNFENSQKELKTNNFNPEEEWKQILELKNKIASFSGITCNLAGENKSCEIQNICGNYLNIEQNSKQSSKEVDSWLQNRSSRKDKSCCKNFKQRKYIPVKEADNWLCSRSLEKDTLNMAKNFERINIRLSSELSPADTVRKAFTSYLKKEGNEKWLVKN